MLMHVSIRGFFVLTIPLLLKQQLLLERKTLLFFLLHGSGPKIVVYGKQVFIQDLLQPAQPARFLSKAILGESIKTTLLAH